jgi:hypothetical protein
MGDDVVGRGRAESPGSGGASPYLRRACHEQASARRMGLWRQTAPYLNAYDAFCMSRTTTIRGLTFFR